MNKNEKIWENMFSYWKSFELLTIKTIKFKYGKETFDDPWYSIELKRQVRYENNPIRTTANHLMKNLKEKDPEFIAAYKMYVTLKEYNKDKVFFEIFQNLFQKHNENILDWWYSNSRYLLPEISFQESAYKLYSNLTSDDWKIIVEASTDMWNLVAKEYKIILIPDFLKPGSKELLDIKHKSQKEYERSEYETYLRLKEKYEK